MTSVGQRRRSLGEAGKQRDFIVVSVGAFSARLRTNRKRLRKGWFAGPTPLGQAGRHTRRASPRGGPLPRGGSDPPPSLPRSRRPRARPAIGGSRSGSLNPEEHCDKPGRVAPRVNALQRPGQGRALRKGLHVAGAEVQGPRSWTTRGEVKKPTNSPLQRSRGIC